MNEDSFKSEKNRFLRVYASACHNAAVEYEFIRDYNEALKYYKMAVDIIENVKDNE